LKYAIFILFALIFIPWVAAQAGKSAVNRERLLSLLVLSPAIVGMTGVNFMSMENYRGPDRGFEVCLTDLVTWGLMVYLISKRKSEIKWFPLGTVFLALFFLAACISATQAPLMIGSIFTIWKLFRLSMVFWTVGNMLRVGTSPRALFYGWVVMALMFTADCLYQKYKLHMYRVQGFFDHSNGVPIFLDQTLAFVLITALGDKGLPTKWVWAGVIGSLGMTFCVLATQSRMGMAITAGILIVALILVNIISNAKRTRLVSVFVFACLLAGGAMAANTIITRIKTAPESSEQARVEFNISADMMAAEHPLGVGINNFSDVLTMNSHYNGHIEVMAAEIENGQGGVAHHIYKLTAAETGRYGLVFFLLVLGRFLIAGLAAGWRGRKGLYGFQAWGLVIGSVAMHIIGNMEWSLRVTTVSSMFACVCGSIVGFSAITSDKKKGKPKSSPPVRAKAVRVMPIEKTARNEPETQETNDAPTVTLNPFRVGSAA